MAVSRHFLGGELMLSLAIFLTSSVRKATIIICATTLCNQRVTSRQGLPRTTEKGSRARAVVAPVVGTHRVGVQFGLGFGRTHCRADGLFVGRFLFGQGIGQEFLDPRCGGYLPAVLAAGRVGRIDSAPFSSRSAQGAFAVAIRYNRSGCHFDSPSFFSSACCSGL